MDQLAYTKVGRVVHYSITLETLGSSWTVAPSGSLKIRGMPFTVQD